MIIRNKYSDFFYKVSSKDNIDSNMKMMVLSLEDKMVSVIREQYVDFIGMKLLYMKRYLNNDMKKIRVICCDDGDLNLVKKELEKMSKQLSALQKEAMIRLIEIRNSYYSFQNSERRSR